MKKRMFKTLLVPCLLIVVLACTTHSAFATYSTLYLSYDRDDFYQASKSKSGSFSYGGYTYQYGISSSIHYWSFNYKDTTYSSLGTIRVSGGACVNNPPGARSLGVLRLKTELILCPYSTDWFGNRKTQQDGEIAIWQSHMAAVNLAIDRPGDQTLRNILSLVAQIGWMAMTAAADCPVPFDPTWITYLDTGGKRDLNAGPAGKDADAYVQGVMGWQSPAWKPWCYSTAQVAYDFAYRYLKDDATGYKTYELKIKISVDFGYVEDTHTGTYRNVKVKYDTFTETWKVKVYW